MRSLLCAVAMVLLVSLSGCGATSEPTGNWGSEAKGQPNLHLAKDGKVSGTDGCNRLMTTWKQDDEKVRFGVVAGTLMHCEGVDTWLSAMNSATVKEDVMTIRDESGATIGTLKRTE